MKKVIFQTIIFLLTSLTLSGQTSKRVYKKLTDTSFVAGDIILPPKIIFALGSCAMSSQTKDSVKLIADFLKKHPSFKIAIISYTDTKATRQSALELTQLRADSICNYLSKAFQISKDKLMANGYGGRNPIIHDSIIRKVDKSTEEGQDAAENIDVINRRIEIKILGTK